MERNGDAARKSHETECNCEFGNAEGGPLCPPKAGKPHKQRHEVCLKYRGSDYWASIRWPPVCEITWPAATTLEGWNTGILE